MTKRERIEDYFADGDDFEDTLHCALEQAQSGSDIDFCLSVQKIWETYGLSGFLSERQYQRLALLAGL